MDEEDIGHDAEDGALGRQLVVPRDAVLAIPHKPLVVRVLIFCFNVL